MTSKNRFILFELRREFIDTYRIHYKDETPFINWSDALCAAYAEYIANAIATKFTPEQLFRQENKVSETTIQRIVNSQLIIKDDLHWTTRRVLDNVCMFLDYNNWNEFSNLKAKKISYISDEARKAAIDLPAVENENYDEYLELIHNAKQAEFDVYKNLPSEDYSELRKYYDPEGPEYQRIVRTAYKMNLEGLKISYKHNHSRFTIDVVVLLDVQETRGLCTREFWHLEWMDIKGGFVHYFSLVTLQLISFTEDKIYFIDYIPFCERDEKYVERVYKNDTTLGMDDMSRKNF